MAFQPNGGTCPGLALSQALQTVQVSNQVGAPYVSMVVLTDGLFYDMPVPAIMSAALRQSCVNIFTLGIAYGKQGSGDHPGTNVRYLVTIETNFSVY